MWFVFFVFFSCFFYWLGGGSFLVLGFFYGFFGYTSLREVLSVIKNKNEFELSFKKNKISLNSLNIRIDDENTELDQEYQYSLHNMNAIGLFLYIQIIILFNIDIRLSSYMFIKLFLRTCFFLL